MNQRITRRRFGQLAIAGTAAAAIATLASKTFGQTPNLVIVGVSPGGPQTSTDAATGVDSTDVDSTTAASTPAASTPLGLVEQSLNVTLNQLQTLTIPQVLQNGTPILQSGDELTGLTFLADGRLVLAITPASTSNNGDNPTRLTILGTSPTTVTVSGLQKQEKLESLLVLNDGSLIGLVVKKNGTPPVKLVNINVQTGAISNNNSVTLPANQRFSNLAQCPDGKIYTTAVGQQGETSLVQLDLAQKKPITLAQLNVNGTVWNNGLQSLVCFGTGQLLAFGAPRYVALNSLYTVNASNGTMTALTQFNAAKITVAPTIASLG